MESHHVCSDGISPIVQPRPSDEKRSSPPSEIDREEQAAAKEADFNSERITAFKDYLRVFTYATKFDYALMIPAAFASIGSGVVWPSILSLPSLPVNADPRLMDCRLFP
jgi:hypothetical protein